MYYELTGSNIDRKVLFLHGFPLSGASWHHQATLDASLATCLIPDLPGFGKSAHLDRARTLDLMIDHIFAMLDALSWDKCIWTGLSMGGYLALRAYEREPDRFQALLIVDSKSEPDDDKARIGRTEAIRTIRTEGVPGFAAPFIDKALHKDTPDAVRESLLQMASMNSTEGLEQALIAMAARTDTTSVVQNCGIPLAVVCGSGDVITPPEIMHKMAERAPFGSYHEIEGAGHLSAFEQPDSFNGIAADFFRQIIP